MTKLIWGAAGERVFEAGVDRGVLYVPGLPGVSWNGLKTVNESPNGGESRPYYIDGFKYANVASAEEFNATIEAFSSPSEFAICDGSIQLALGIFATQQPRKSFGLSYRTLVGNDLIGIDGGYKIHLVYNALAAPAGHQNNSTGQTIEPMGLSWDISTRPPIGAFGYKPSAHIIIDSRQAPTLFLADIESILYGTASVQPRLPNPDEILTRFADTAPLDIVLDPSGGYSVSGPSVTVVNADTFAIDHVSVIDHGDGTFEII